MVGYTYQSKRRKTIPVPIIRTGACPPTFLASGYCGAYRMKPVEGRTVDDVRRDALIQLGKMDLEPVFCVQG